MVMLFFGLWRRRRRRRRQRRQRWWCCGVAFTVSVVPWAYVVGVQMLSIMVGFVEVKSALEETVAVEGGAQRN